MGYCAITDVVAAFPNFVRNATGSIQDSQIQSWIDQHAARINAALAQRGINASSGVLPNGQALSADQSNWLIILNADAAIGEMGRALEGNVTFQPGEISLVAGRRKNYETTLNDIRGGRYDAYFGQVSRFTNTGTYGFGGAEADDSTPAERGENRAFGRKMKI